VPRQTISSDVPELVSVMENSFSNERRPQQAGKHTERVFGDVVKSLPLRTSWIADAHRDYGKRFVVRADEKLTAFLELESAIRAVSVKSAQSAV
jgi:hypothetical protein